MRIILLALVSVSISLISHNAEAMFPWGKGGRKDPNSTEMSDFARSLPPHTPSGSSPANTPISANGEEQAPSKTTPIQIGTGPSRRGSAPVTMENVEQYPDENPDASHARAFIPPHVLIDSYQPRDGLVVGSYPGQRLKFNRDGLY